MSCATESKVTTGSPVVRGPKQPLDDLRKSVPGPTVQSDGRFRVALVLARLAGAQLGLADNEAVTLLIEAKSAPEPLSRGEKPLIPAVQFGLVKSQGVKFRFELRQASLQGVPPLQPCCIRRKGDGGLDEVTSFPLDLGNLSGSRVMGTSDLVNLVVVGLMLGISSERHPLPKSAQLFLAILEKEQTERSRRLFNAGPVG
jgi:hypothetical protein